ncbi:hypothetical protein B0I35DRAFT_482872 [Stachybotrys elegans]|uniref:F-box domain-containing protein n=1 Tax=Stachybotrys elegans TaxID=80388 RepID=A0A8K0WNC8_9HYPO|nr:hypothetical protein B0I35DRAFT_482872 [Stachybotrys elegans]
MVQIKDLPLEIWIAILSHLGPEYFHQDTNRLYVSKRWYEAAFTLFAQHVNLTPLALLRLTRDESVIKRIQPHVAKFKIFFPSVSELDETPFAEGRRTKYPWDWADLVNSSMKTLGTYLTNCPNLESVHIGARPDPKYVMGLRYLDTISLTGFLTARAVTELTYDMGVLPPNLEHSKPDNHLCAHLHALLPQLRKLWLRNDGLCECLLDFPEGTVLPHLEEIIINLSLSGLSTKLTVFQATRRCTTDENIGKPEPPRPITLVMEDQIKKLAEMAPNARIVRVLATKRLPSLDLSALDGKTGKWSLVKKDLPWDEEGEPIAERE